MKIVMVGTGYVGLVSGACFSEFGVEVICVDKDVAKIDALEAGNLDEASSHYGKAAARWAHAQSLTYMN